MKGEKNMLKNIVKEILATALLGVLIFLVVGILLGPIPDHYNPRKHYWELSETVRND